MSDRLTQRGRIAFTDETPHEFIQLVMSTLRESDFIHAEVDLNLSHDDGGQVVVVVYEIP